MVILPLKPPCTITIIERGATLVLLVVTGRGGCCKIFGIRKNRLISKPFGKLICGPLGWVPTRDLSLWFSVFPDMDISATLVTSHIWPGRWPSSIATNISIAGALEVNLLQSLVDLLLNGHSVCLWKWRFFLRFYLLVDGCHRFESTWSRYYRVSSCTRDS